MSQAIESVTTDSVSADVSALEAMLGDELTLEGDGLDLSGFDTDILEVPVDADAAPVLDLGADEASADMLDAALGEVTIQEAKQQVYAEQSAALELLETAADTPATDEARVDEAAAAPAPAADAKPAAKGKRAAKPKPEGEAAEKKERMTFVTHSKAEILAARTASSRDLLNLELTDFALPAEEQEAKRVALMKEIDENTAKKVAEKALMVFAGKAATQTVLKIAFETLARDGYLTSGNEGNLMKALLKKPFSQGTAASQGAQIMQLFPLLKIAHRSKGRLDPNPNSTILARTLTELGLTMKE